MGEDEFAWWFIIFTIFAVIVLFVVGFFLDPKTCEWVEGSVENIHSLKQENNYAGHFVLFFGRIGIVEYYYFFKETEQGFLLDKVNAMRTIVVETDDITPRYVTYTCNCKTKSCSSPTRLNTLYVPLNTIKEEYII